MKNSKINYLCGSAPAQTVARCFSGTKVLAILATVACALQARSQITTFDATTNSYTTTVECISPSGAVTGYYDIRDVAHHQFLEFAFIRDLNGQTISFGPPTTNDFDPQGVAINSAGVVAGDYSKYAGQAPDGNGGTFSYYFQSSFLRSVDGTVFNIDPTDAYSSLVLVMNEPGTVGGICYSAIDGSGHFFLRSAKGAVTEFDPEAGEFPAAMTINNAGTVAGSYYDADFNLHGFLRTAKGAITVFDEPDAVNGTVANVINESGAIAGYYYDSNFVSHGFVRSAKGQFTTFDPQGSTGTYALCINPAGTVAGNYTDSNGVYHGFERASNGQITTFDPQGSVETVPLSITPGGLVTGYYQNSTIVDGHIVSGFYFQTGTN